MNGSKDKQLESTPISKLFQERLGFHNSFDEKKFKEWVFHPAMLFASDRKWWGDLGKRNRLHEGLDLCLFRDREGAIQYLEENTKVTVIFSGKIVKVSEDFLGASVFVSHNNYERDGSRLHTIYGHVNPSERIYTGEKLGENDIIGTIADARKNSESVHSHLHISVAWIPDSIKSQELGWQIISHYPEVMLLDPLRVIEFPYSIECVPVK
ncbi:peptidoglycan DD-metalloendopeptidase family protein [Chloroflexota bacterium]